MSTPGLTGSSPSESHTRLQPGCQPGLQPSQDSAEGEQASKLTPWLLAAFSSLGLLDSTGRLQFCSDFWPEVTFHSLPCEPLQYDSMFSMWVTQEGKRKEEHKAARANKMAVTVLDNFMEMILHHFCWILFIRRQSLSLGYTQGEGMTQQCDYQKAETIENYIRRCLWHQPGDVPLRED